METFVIMLQVHELSSEVNNKISEHVAGLLISACEKVSLFLISASLLG